MNEFSQDQIIDDIIRREYKPELESLSLSMSFMNRDRYRSICI